MFLSKVLSDIEYFADGQVAVVHIEEQHLNKHELEMDDSRDIIDMVMNITSVQGAALFREEGEGIYKLSLRSKGQFEVLGIAESFSGGGHLYAAGATLHGEYEHVKLEVVDHFLQRIDARKKSSKLE